MGKDHRVTVAVGHQDRLIDRAESLQQCVIRDAPGADGVVLSLSCLPRRRLVCLARPAEQAFQDLLRSPLARL
jgi:hypothetical protein